MRPRRLRVLATLTEEDSGPKGINILWNEGPESSFKEIKRVVTTETLLNYTDRRLPSTVHTDASNKQLGAVISQNKKPIAFF